MKRWKPSMGVEGPSFYEHQKQKKEEGNPPSSGSPRRKKTMFESIFGQQPEQKAAGATPPPAPAPSRESTMRPGYHRRGLTAADPERWFRVSDIWTQVGNTVLMAGNQSYIVDTLTLPPPPQGSPEEKEIQTVTEISQFFGIPASEFQGLTLQQVWQNIIGPLFETLEMSMNRVKPFGIPGSIRFELDPRGSLIMVYRDR